MVDGKECAVGRDDLLFVGVDTSNYTTSLALCDARGELLANLKAPLLVRAGECGLRQSDAVFAHLKNAPELWEKLTTLTDGRCVGAVGYSAKPRGRNDSYMPCFFVGENLARAYCAGSVGAGGVAARLYPFDHQRGHITAALFSAGRLDLLERKSPFMAFHISGGTTDALLVTPDDSCEGFSVSEIGTSADLHAGQLIDRVGVALEASFPCGAVMEEWALGYYAAKERGESLPPLPKMKLSVTGGVSHLSGAENRAAKLFADLLAQGVEKPLAKSVTAAFLFDFIGATIGRMAEQLSEKYGDMPILFAGGVMSNRFLQETLGQRENTYFAEPAFSSDNAAGIALLTRRKLLNA